ncbi:hypothetical protein HU200_021288 [Digitaria exilis]|uniref:Uncharacterized protein n=1 Tax=Digitaria exilis TaxID=1010633 RepID=A0A835F053_9POAL|nr:hypothetical protein HU200_021288 [Digitaria exilis]
MTVSLDTNVLVGSRETVATFIMNQVNPAKGEFHWNNPDIMI